MGWEPWGFRQEPWPNPGECPSSGSRTLGGGQGTRAVPVTSVLAGPHLPAGVWAQGKVGTGDRAWTQSPLKAGVVRSFSAPRSVSGTCGGPRQCPQGSCSERAGSKARLQALSSGYSLLSLYLNPGSACARPLPEHSFTLTSHPISQPAGGGGFCQAFPTLRQSDCPASASHTPCASPSER